MGLTRLLAYREWMLFVDGENMTKRGQAVLEGAGVTLAPDPSWRKDTYLWAPGHEATYAFFAQYGFIVWVVQQPGKLRAVVGCRQSTDVVARRN